MRNYRTYYTGDGSTKQFDVTFPYLRRAHVHVFVNGQEVPYKWLNEGRLETLTIPPALSSIRLERTTPTEPIHTIQNNRPTPAEHYNELTQQALFRSEEMETDSVVEDANDAARRSKESATASETSAKRSEAAALKADQTAEQLKADFDDDANEVLSLASRWASDPEDAPKIDDGINTPNQSAYHWSEKSRKSALSSSSYADKAQNLVTAAEAAFQGYPAGTFLDLGHTSDKYELFNNDLGYL